jgi:aryl-alcohol dehydrogenase-like predicted oxidoreductase
MFGDWGNSDAEDGAHIVDRALDSGVNLIDTADRYALGRTEEIVGRALVGRRDDVVLATKVGYPMGDDPNHRGASRRWIVGAVEDSLRRLQTDCIDLYRLHRPDYATPRQVSAGGSPPDITRASWNLGVFGMSTDENRRRMDAVTAPSDLADEAGVSLIHLALAFVIHHPGVTAAIMGPRTVEHLDASLGAADLRIPEDVLDRIDQIVAPGTDGVPSERYAAADPLFSREARRC